MFLTIDIETTGYKGDDVEILSLIAEGVKPPGNLKKEESIERWMIEERPEAVKKAIAQTSLDGAFCEICCIGYAWNDEPPIAICDGRGTIEILDEFVMRLNEQVKARSKPSQTNPISKVIGHCVHSFDLRVLWQCMIRSRITPPACLPWQAKPWDDQIADIMLLWNPAPDKKASLHKICTALGIPSPKSDMEGKDVAAFAHFGLWDEIATYCKGDIVASRNCFYRMCGKPVFE